MLNTVIKQGSTFYVTVGVIINSMCLHVAGTKVICHEYFVSLRVF